VDSVTTAADVIGMVHEQERVEKENEKRRTHASSLLVEVRVSGGEIESWKVWKWEQVAHLKHRINAQQKQRDQFGVCISFGGLELEDTMTFEGLQIEHGAALELTLEQKPLPIHAGVCFRGSGHDVLVSGDGIVLFGEQTLSSKVEDGACLFVGSWDCSSMGLGSGPPHSRALAKAIYSEVQGTNDDETTSQSVQTMLSMNASADPNAWVRMSTLACHHEPCGLCWFQPGLFWLPFWCCGQMDSWDKEISPQQVNEHRASASALHMAIWHNKPRTVRTLIEGGSNLYMKHYIYGWTPLELARYMDRHECIVHLEEVGAPAGKLF